MKNQFMVFLLLFHSSYTHFINDSFDLDISSIKKCSETKNYPITVTGISIAVVNNKVIASGTLSTSVDLITPIKAEIKVERKEIGIWIKLPCIDKVGSCTYEDLCQFGISNNKTCPSTLTDNNIPCRCPIYKGTYTIPQSLSLSMDSHLRYNSIIKGDYWAKLVIAQENDTLACFQIFFSINKVSNRNFIPNSKPSVVLIR